MEEIKLPAPAAPLMDAAMQAEMARRQNNAQKIARVTLAVEKILIDEDMSWDDWYLVIDMMGTRTSKVVGPMKVKEINEMYARTQ